MQATRCCRWGLVLALVVAAPASAAQVIAPRDVAARLAVGPDGRAFVVSPSARSGANALSSIRRRAARPGAAFGPSRALMGPAAGARPVDAGVAADGSGVIIVQARRSVRAVAFGPSGALGAPAALSAPGARADFAASAVAPSGAAVVVWFRHRGAGRWRLEAATREPGARRFGPPEPVSAFVRRPCCTSVSVAIGERGDAVVTWSSTSRPAVWAALRRPGSASAGRSGWPPTQRRPARRSSARAGPRRCSTAPSTCRCARATACSCIERRPRVRSGRPSTSTAAAG